MTDSDKIRDAWHSTVGWPKPGNVLRVHIPPPVRCVPLVDVPVKEESGNVEFRYEQGTLNGRRASRVMGKLGDTDIEVSISYED